MIHLVLSFLHNNSYENDDYIIFGGIGLLSIMKDIMQIVCVDPDYFREKKK